MKYLKLFGLFAKFSLMTELEYRVHSLVSLARAIVGFFVLMTFFQIVFNQTKVIGDWTKPQIFLFYGVWLLVDFIFDFFFSNLSKLQNYIEEGSLDKILVRPVNPLFLISFRHVGVINALNFVLSLIVINYAIKNLNISINFPLLLGFLAMVSMGVIIFYSIYTIVVTTAFWTTRTPYFEFLETLSGMAKYPLTIFGRNWQFILTFVVPLVFVVTVPTKFILGMYDTFHMVAPVVALVLFLIATKFWNFALRYYSSASS